MSSGPKTVRAKLRRAQGGICPLCSSELRGSFRSAADRPTLDHVFPRVRNGPSAKGNYLTVHVGCNQSKGGREPFPCELIWLAAVNARLGYPWPQ